MAGEASLGPVDPRRAAEPAGQTWQQYLFGVSTVTPEPENLPAFTRLLRNSK